MLPSYSFTTSVGSTVAPVVAASGVSVTVSVLKAASAGVSVPVSSVDVPLTFELYEL